MDQTIIRWQAILGVLALMLVVFAVLMVNATHTRTEAEAQNEVLQQAVVRLQNEQLGLQQQLSQVGTSSYVESVARTDYAYLKEGELRFEVVNPDSLDAYTESEMRIFIEEMGY